MESFSIQLLKEVYNWKPWDICIMSCINTHGMLPKLFTKVGNRYLNILASKLFIFKIYETILLPVIIIISLKYSDCVYSIASVDYI